MTFFYEKSSNYKNFKMDAKYELVMVRHCESEWNRQNRFTGWHDAELSEKGARDAEKAGKWLKEAGCKFDVGFSEERKRHFKSSWKRPVTFQLLNLGG